jgi:hypothetical protein
MRVRAFLGLILICLAGCNSAIDKCQKEGYAELVKQHGGSQPPQEEVNQLTRRCVERQQK